MAEQTNAIFSQTPEQRRQVREVLDMAHQEQVAVEADRRRKLDEDSQKRRDAAEKARRAEAERRAEQEAQERERARDARLRLQEQEANVAAERAKRNHDQQKATEERWRQREVHAKEAALREAKLNEAHYAKLQASLRQARPASGGPRKSMMSPAGRAPGLRPKSGNPSSATYTSKPASTLKAWSTDDAVPRGYK